MGGVGLPLKAPGAFGQIKGPPSPPSQRLRHASPGAPGARPRAGGREFAGRESLACGLRQAEVGHGWRGLGGTFLMFSWGHLFFFFLRGGGTPQNVFCLGLPQTCFFVEPSIWLRICCWFPLQHHNMLVSFAHPTKGTLKTAPSFGPVGKGSPKYTTHFGGWLGSWLVELVGLG